jgi:hypothetical protein
MHGFHNSSFDPQTLVVLETAFDEAWLTLKSVPLLKDRVSDFELSICFAIEAGCISGTIKLLRNGFIDWAKESRLIYWGHSPWRAQQELSGNRQSP